MATLEDLTDVIYHEKQEPGSMLCAQHALNSLLQGRYFTPPDLSDIARTLDEQEAEYDDDNHGHASANMDDTGFFSVQVLEKALQVWGLTLVRWRSEGMRPFQAHPHTQIAFILNLEQHWYTLRRFGMPPPDPYSDTDSTVGHWFNLNSFLEKPEWVSKLYLGVLLQQAETEGYSVFAVVKENPDIVIPPSAADQLAATIPEQFHRSASRRSTARTAPQTDVKTPVAGFEDEDMELQAALQASLMGGTYDFPTAPTFVPPRASSSAAGVLTPTGRQFPPVIPAARVEEEDNGGVEELDPVAASMARNRAFLQRMQREQEAALREGYEEETARVESAAALRRARGLPEEEDEDEDEMLRRAIAESEAMARSMRRGAATRQAEGDEDDDQPDELDDDDEPFVPPPPIPLQTASTSRYPPHRVYDDEDAELQAALRASLEGLPPGFQIPDSPPRPALRTLPGAPGANIPASPPVAAMQRQPSGASESEVETEIETESEAEQPQVEQLSMEEIRRRRLARFGG